MTWLEILTKGGLAASGIVALLERARALAPDLGDDIDGILTELNTAISAENITAIVAALPGEFKNIIKGQLDPRDHPSDF